MDFYNWKFQDDTPVYLQLYNKLLYAILRGDFCLPKQNPRDCLSYLRNQFPVRDFIIGFQDIQRYVFTVLLQFIKQLFQAASQFISSQAHITSVSFGTVSYFRQYLVFRVSKIMLSSEISKIHSTAVVMKVLIQAFSKK